MSGRTDSRRRLLALLVGLVVLAGSLMLRLSWWQIAQHDVLAAEARAQTTLRLQIPAQRGDIYDRTGTVVLATTIDHYRLAAAPNMLAAAQIPDEADRLISILGLDAAGARTLRDGLASDRPYVVLATGLAEATAQQLRTDLADGKLSELSLETEPVRELLARAQPPGRRVLRDGRRPPTTRPRGGSSRRGRRPGWGR